MESAAPREPGITHPDKVLFPDDGITKGDLAAYYAAISSAFLPHVDGRPVTMERYPNGIGEAGFLQKNVSRGFPAWLERIEAPKANGVVHYTLITDRRSLLWVVNQNCVTQHVWTARRPALYQPDLCVFDLDPASEDPSALRVATLAVHDYLAELGLPSWVKTSGSKGFHVVVPLDREADFDQVGAFAHAVGAVLVKRLPDVLTQEFSKVARGGRIFMDTGRNAYGATFAAPYTVRARPGAPVSAPCTWDEVERGTVEPRSFGLMAMAGRVAETGDLWADLYETPCSLAAAAARLEEALTEAELHEALRARRRRSGPRHVQPS
jgi:bifunctional non-homologous end joining protein LigD